LRHRRAALRARAAGDADEVAFEERDSSVFNSYIVFFVPVPMRSTFADGMRGAIVSRRRRPSRTIPAFPFKLDSRFQLLIGKI